MSAVPDRIGPYRVRSRLGAGGMGVVYLAQLGEAGAEVALKTLRVPKLGQLAGIRREVHALARLSHPGIVRILDEGVSEGIPWYAMELHRGRTLEQVREGRPPLQELLTLVRRLCDPLRYLHGEGLVHRDLKPANVLVEGDGHPVIIDFGLAQRFVGEASRDELDVESGASGTLGYMAPEQLMGLEVDARADLYALGAICHELLTGQLPFAEPSGRVSIARQLESSPSPPSALAPGLPPELDDLVVRLLAREPRERLGYADDVARILESLGACGGGDRKGHSARTYLYRPRLAGRELPMAELVAHALRLDRGIPAFVAVGGESGIGKTRLVRQLGREVAERGIDVLTGSCPALHPEPLAGVRSVLRTIAEQCVERGPREADAVVGARGKVLALHEPLLGALPGLEELPEPPLLSPASGEERVIGCVAEILWLLAARTPLLLVVDDVHWADDLTLRLLAHVVRLQRTRPVALMVIVTYRPEGVSPGLAQLLSERIECLALSRMGANDLASLVGDMLALPEPPEGLVSHILRRSGGNPFFAAEHLRAATDGGALVRGADGVWRLSGMDEEGLAEVPLPGSLRDVVLDRLSRLSAGARHVVDAMCVLGRRVPAELLASVAAGEDGADRAAEIVGLVALRILDEAADGFSLAHDTFREVAYAALDASHRRMLHGLAARVTETSGAGFEGDVGRHWELSGDLDRARRGYLEAARSATRKYALVESERLYRAYLRLATEVTAESVDAARDLVDRVLRPAGRYHEAETLQRMTLQWARELGDEVRVAQQLAMLGTVVNELGRRDESRQIHEETLGEARRLGLRALEGSTLGNIANVELEEQRFEEARRGYEEAYAIALEVDQWSDAVSWSSNLATLETIRERYEEAREHLTAAQQHARRGGPIAEAVVLMSIAALEYRCGRLDEARSRASAAAEVHRRTGERSREATCEWNLGALELDSGNVAAANEHHRVARRLYEELGDELSVGHATVKLAVGALLQGDLDRAAELALEAERTLAASPRDLVSAVCTRGHVALARGEDPAELLERARAIRAQAASETAPATWLRSWGAEVAALEDAAAAAARGETLLHGYRREQLPWSGMPPAGGTSAR